MSSATKWSVTASLNEMSSKIRGQEKLNVLLSKLLTQLIAHHPIVLLVVGDNHDVGLEVERPSKVMDTGERLEEGNKRGVPKEYS